MARIECRTEGTVQSAFPAEHLMSTKYHEVSFEGKVLELVVMFSGKMHS